MDDDDFRALIELVHAELRNSGASDIGNDRHYLHRDEEAEEMRLLRPQEHLLAMLAAFGRLMATQDQQTYFAALGRMRDIFKGRGPEGAVVVQAQGDRERPDIDLGKAPELWELRRDLHDLIARLADSGGRPEPMRRF